MTRPPTPDVMSDPDRALELHRRGEWSRRCPIAPCPTDLQGGIEGVNAHIRTVHPVEARLRGLR